VSAPQPSRSVAWSTALAVGGAVLLVLTLLVGLRWDGIQDVDGAVTHAAVDLVTDSATTLSVARALTHLGDPLVVSLATVVLVLGMIAVRSYRTAVYLAVVRIAVVVVTAGLKEVVARARPHQLHPVAVAHGYSFPSGHASGSAALWCSVAVIIATRTRRSVAAAVALVVPVVVAATRVLLGVHFLSDVVAGFFLGTEIAIGLALRFWRLPSSFPRG
jgi:membrane-associated phospholipid phosphatase